MDLLKQLAKKTDEQLNEFMVKHLHDDETEELLKNRIKEEGLDKQKEEAFRKYLNLDILKDTLLEMSNRMLFKKNCVIFKMTLERIEALMEKVCTPQK